jgi:peptide/nickel transport system substrate-binding protein
MSFQTRTGAPLPEALVKQADQMRADQTSRREFLTLASAFGASAAMAYAMLGQPRPSHASTEQPSARSDGVVRVQQEVHALKDPRLYDWPQMANVSRGWLEYLLTYENDGTFRPMLLESWEISDNARTYTLKVRPGVTWNNGDPFTAKDVARNITRWCERDLKGNSMAGRFATLIDPATNRALDGAIEVIDAQTVRLNLPKPDISLIPGMADYPAAVVHESFEPETMLTNPIGTGPYLPAELEAGSRAVLTRNTAHRWWNEGNGAWMDRIEFIDLGTDPAVWARAAQTGEIDMTYSVDGEYADLIATSEGWVKHDVVSMSTVVVRPNQLAEVNGQRPYADQRVRQAITMAVDNHVLLELGIGGHGQTAENHHIGPAHPEYTSIGLPPHDPRAALDLLKEAGMERFEMELHTIDDLWRKNTTDAVVAQLRDAGFQAKTTIVPGNVYWENWNKFPFSATDWNHRPLGVQIWALAYRSDEAWNEFGYANPEFDAILDAALGTLDLNARKALVERGARLLQEEAVTIQPYWRTLANHTVEALQGGAHHISFEIRPAELRWT